jgi:hypothetical protein
LNPVVFTFAKLLVIVSSLTSFDKAPKSALYMLSRMKSSWSAPFDAKSGPQIAPRAPPRAGPRLRAAAQKADYAKVLLGNGGFFVDNIVGPD